MTRTDEYPPMNLGPGNPWGRVIRERLDEIARLQEQRRLMVRGDNRQVSAGLQTASETLSEIAATSQESSDLAQQVLDGLVEVNAALDEATTAINSAPIPGVGRGNSSNFTLTNTWTTRASFTIDVPAGRSVAYVTLAGSLRTISPTVGMMRFQIGSSLSPEFLWMDGRMVGASGGSFSMALVQGNHVAQVPVSPGGSLTCNLQVRTDTVITPGVTPGPANGWNRAELRGLVSFSV